MAGGSLIRRARRRAGLSQRDLAERLGRHQSVVGRWEAGITEPAYSTVREAVRACGVELDSRLLPRDLDLERGLAEQLQRSPAARVASVVNAARLLRA